MKNILFGTLFSLVLTAGSVSAVYSGTNFPGDKKKKCSSHKECKEGKKEECKGEKKSCCESGKKKCATEKKSE